jgi:hypothetical protein
MPLVSTTHMAIGDREEISFAMKDGEDTIRVDVHRSLLVAIGSLGQNSSAQQLTILEKHKTRVEQIASAKYDEGEYQRYANGAVVPVTPSDWERYTQLSRD